jgi:predicted DNA-binding transcriptional regulator AlpA
MAERLLYGDEVAEIIGVAARSITAYHYEANRLRAEGKADESTFPEPVDRVSRPVPREGRHAVAVMANRWRASDIAAWVEHRTVTARWPEERRAEVAAGLRAMVA